MLGVSNCDECDRGVLVLDCTSGPKKWKLGCNVCDVIVNIFKGAAKVTVNESKSIDFPQIYTYEINTHFSVFFNFSRQTMR